MGSISWPSSHVPSDVTGLVLTTELNERHSLVGERPDDRRPREVWENGVRQAARYRAQYDIADPSDALGPRPESREQQRDWERADEAVQRSARRLGREATAERDVDLGIGF